MSKSYMCDDCAAWHTQPCGNTGAALRRELDSLKSENALLRKELAWHCPSGDVPAHATFKHECEITGTFKELELLRKVVDAARTFNTRFHNWADAKGQVAYSPLDEPLSDLDKAGEK